MKIMLSITAYEIQEEENQKYINSIEKELKEKKYIILSRTLGLHQNAKRLHWHYAFLLDDKEVIYKKPIQPNNKNHQRRFYTIFKTKLLFNNHISVYTQLGEGYDEEKGLAYPLKEYNTYAEIKSLELIYGKNPKEIEDLRLYANTIYKEQTIINRRKNEKKIETETINKNAEEVLNEFYNEFQKANYERPSLGDMFRYLYNYQKEIAIENNTQMIHPDRIKRITELYYSKKVETSIEYWMGKYNF